MPVLTGRCRELGGQRPEVCKVGAARCGARSCRPVYGDFDLALFSAVIVASKCLMQGALRKQEVWPSECSVGPRAAVADARVRMAANAASRPLVHFRQRTPA